jgi:NAD(P)H-dependent FMN reductase
MISQDFLKAPVKIIAICGSLREGSYTRAALQVALQGAAESRAEVKLIDLRETNWYFRA